jgi:hypothetical protein
MYATAIRRFLKNTEPKKIADELKAIAEEKAAADKEDA